MSRRNLASAQAEAGETPDEDTALLAADLLRTLETAAARK